MHNSAGRVAPQGIITDNPLHRRAGQVACRARRSPVSIPAMLVPRQRGDVWRSLLLNWKPRLDYGHGGPIPVAERSKERVSGRWLAGSNRTGGMDVCVVCCTCGKDKRKNAGQLRQGKQVRMKYEDSKRECHRNPHQRSNILHNVHTASYSTGSWVISWGKGGGV